MHSRLPSHISQMLRFVYAVLLLGLAVITAAQSTNVTVPADDSRIQYTGNWTDQGNGQHKFASASGSGLTFVFQGALCKAKSMQIQSLLTRSTWQALRSITTPQSTQTEALRRCGSTMILLKM